MKSFSDLTEQEIIALAISSEDDDARTYMGFANDLMQAYPASAKVFMEMAEEENHHRLWLTKLYQRKFGDFIPLIRRADVNGFVKHTPSWMLNKMDIDTMRKRAEVKITAFIRRPPNAALTPRSRNCCRNWRRRKRGMNHLLRAWATGM
jgi:erythrin-vacuolar iron transport family protein